MTIVRAAQDTAHEIAYFASEESGYVTGQSQNVDGGLLMAQGHC